MDLAKDFHIDPTRGMSPRDADAPPSGTVRRRRTDGRRLRSERTRQLIIEAYLSLIRESPRAPKSTAAEIAARAGCSVRSIFERFPDLHALRVAAADFGLAQAAALAPARDVDADRATRIKSQVETRAGTCDRSIALWRALLSNVDESDALKLRVKIARDLTIKRLELMYRFELDTLPERQRRNTLIALEALTDIENWARMRETHGLSYADACAAWIFAIDRMLPPTPNGQAAASSGIVA